MLNNPQLWVVPYKLPTLQNKMIWEKERIDSFKAWPFKEDAPCSGSKMAAAGFYCVPDNEPIGVCFFCYKVMEFEREDNPIKEHIKHSPNCLFVQLKKPEKHITIAEFINLYKCSNVTYKKLFMKAQLDDLKKIKNETLKYIKNS